MQKGEGRYNIVVIGAGSAGLVTAAGTAGLGGRAALVEARLMGGDCLNFGCVPSKALVAAGKIIHAARCARAFGVDPVEPRFRYDRVFDYMRSRRAAIAPHDSVERFTGLGVDVFEARARFVDAREVELDDGTRLRGKHFAVATGTRPWIPDIPGLDRVPFWTNETFFDDQGTAPASLLVLGGGPIGCELGQVMARLGVRVTIVTDVDRLLPRDDREASGVLEETLAAEGVEIVKEARVRSFAGESDGGVRAEVETPGGRRSLVAERLLVATGRSPNVEDLGLEAAGVRYDTRRGIPVDAALRTNVPHIFALGDVAGPWRFTHTADYQARIVVRNTLLPWPAPRARADYRHVPWITYVDPEVAHFGLRAEDAEERGTPVDVFRFGNDDLDRAITDSREPGFVKVVTRKGKDRILGATVVGPRAGEILHELLVAARHGIGLSQISGTIHAYPSWAQAAQRVGDAYQRSRLTPRAKAIFRWLYRRRR